MASYKFVLATVIALAILACNCQADLISDVCAQTQRPSLCILALRSDPRSKSRQTYKLLTEIGIDKAQRLSKLVADIARKVENTKIREKLEGCAAALDLAYGDLEVSKGLVNKVKDLRSERVLDIEVLGAGIRAVECNRRIHTIPQPPTLKLYNDTFIRLIEIVRVIISKLVQ